jgi:hypothetical protein
MCVAALCGLGFATADGTLVVLIVGGVRDRHQSNQLLDLALYVFCGEVGIGLESVVGQQHRYCQLVS